ncbi:MAG TPA: response regulator, partial [Pirellulales bacterium]
STPRSKLPKQNSGIDLSVAKSSTTTRRTAAVCVGVRQFPLQILFIGDPQQTEFRELVQWLNRRPANFARNITGALAQLREGYCPAIVVLAMPWPGCFSATEVDKLCRAAPLARIIAIGGSWLEGELRTGRPLLGVPRVQWHQWLRLADEIEKLDRSKRSVFSAPITARDDERWIDRANLTVSARHVGIFARSRESGLALAEICAQSGWNGRWIRDPSRDALAQLDVAVFDAHASRAEEYELLSKLKSLIPRMPIVVLQGFLRVDDELKWKQAGATAVVSKPFQIRDLQNAIEHSIAIAKSPPNHS